MWDPFDTGEWWHQRSSYREKIEPPTAAPGDAPLVCLEINEQWAGILAGAATQLAQPSTWDATGTALQTVLGEAIDLIAIIGTAGVCVAPQLQLTANCELQISTDGGATWTTAAGWDTYLKSCIRANQAYVLMTDGLSDPPVPLWNNDGTDWVYGD